MDKWDLRFLQLAAEVAEWSKDPSTRVGTVLVKDRRVVATGYNGFPPGIEDTPERLNDRPTKYALVVHAEMNALLQAGLDARGSTLYLHWPAGPPCSNCAKHIITAGVVRVVAHAGPYPERWAKDFELTLQMFREARIEYEEAP